MFLNVTAGRRQRSVSLTWSFTGAHKFSPGLLIRANQNLFRASSDSDGVEFNTSYIRVISSHHYLLLNSMNICRSRMEGQAGCCCSPSVGANFPPPLKNLKMFQSENDHATELLHLTLDLNDIFKVCSAGREETPGSFMFRSEGRRHHFLSSANKSRFGDKCLLVCC